MSGPNVQVSALTADSTGALIAGGTFAQAGGVPCNSLARWDGAQWTPYGSGLTMSFATGGVWSLNIYHGQLYAAGSMVTAGGKLSHCVAQWSPEHVTAILPPSLAPAPRPLDIWRDGGSRGAMRLRLTLPSAARVRVDVVDVRGRAVRTLADRVLAAGATVVTWDGLDSAGRRVSRGVYFVRGHAAGASGTVRVVTGV